VPAAANLKRLISILYPNNFLVASNCLRTRENQE
jgi:hypothetical protein